MGGKQPVLLRAPASCPREDSAVVLAVSVRPALEKKFSFEVNPIISSTCARWTPQQGCATEAGELQSDTHCSGNSGSACLLQRNHAGTDEVLPLFANPGSPTSLLLGACLSRLIPEQASCSVGLRPRIGQDWQSLNFQGGSAETINLILGALGGLALASRQSKGRK